MDNDKLEKVINELNNLPTIVHYGFYQLPTFTYKRQRQTGNGHNTNIHTDIFPKME